MQLSRFQKTTLAISGVTALAIGLFILVAPQAFYASYGITLGQDPNLLSELRAPGAGLAAFGAVMLAGLVRAAHIPAALVAAFTVYLAFPLGRIVSIVADGMPTGSILGALGIEAAIAGLLIAAFVRNQNSTSGRPRYTSQPG